MVIPTGFPCGFCKGRKMIGTIKCPPAGGKGDAMQNCSWYQKLYSLYRVFPFFSSWLRLIKIPLSSWLYQDGDLAQIAFVIGLPDGSDHISIGEMPRGKRFSQGKPFRLCNDP
jgi:hypothetical protein